MTDKKKNEPPLFLDMDFGEAMKRFARVKPAEVQESIERAKQTKPPGEQAARKTSRKKRDI